MNGLELFLSGKTMQRSTFPPLSMLKNDVLPYPCNHYIFIVWRTMFKPAMSAIQQRWLCLFCKPVISLFYLNAKDINTIVKALRITNMNAFCKRVGKGCIKI